MSDYFALLFIHSVSLSRTCIPLKKNILGASLVVQGLRICLAMQLTCVQSLNRKLKFPHAKGQQSLNIPQLLSLHALEPKCHNEYPVCHN